MCCHLADSMLVTTAMNEPMTVLHLHLQQGHNPIGLID